MLKPKALQAGSTLAIISPAGAPAAEKVHAGIAALEALGYRTKLMPHALDRGPLYFAGTLEDRLADFHAAFADPSVDAVLCTRGGWGSAELLPYLDATLLRANLKPFLGFSDLTSIHIWLLNELGWVSFQAPMVAADFAKPNGPDLTTWHAALSSSAAWSMGPAQGLRVLQPGTGEGLLTGGCLSIYAESLGTPFTAVNRGGILHLEDVGTKPYQWDRMLLHLRHANMLEGVRGIVFGDMSQCVAEEEQPRLEASIMHSLGGFKGPIAIGLRCAHVDSGNVTLPFGVQVRLDCTDPANPRIYFLESAVTP